uniref:Uncharacterized protein K02A2.6like [Amphimedon queenslandica] n=2 Tax=Lepeophtheirus salmonis TaxID=72036 RepID=A0A0K2UB99_LEPSM
MQMLSHEVHWKVLFLTKTQRIYLCAFLSLPPMKQSCVRLCEDMTMPVFLLRLQEQTACPKLLTLCRRTNVMHFLQEIVFRFGESVWSSLLSLRKIILDLLHLSHRGIANMKSIAPCIVWWPNIDNYITNLVNTCYICQELVHVYFLQLK